MFLKPRPFLHRHPAPVDPQNALHSRASDEEAVPERDRHPAMRGLNVSPVHGRHCICDRCAPNKRAA